MAIIVPYQSQQGIHTANGGQAAQYRGASAFMTAGQDNLGRGMRQLAAGVKDLSGVVYGEELRKRNERYELTLLEDYQNIEKEWQNYSGNYREQNQGEKALNAEADAKAFFDEKLSYMNERWAGNERAQNYFKKQIGGMAMHGVDSMRQYASRQQESWKDARFASQLTIFKNTLSDLNATDEQIADASKEFISTYTPYLISKGLDPLAARIQAENIYQEAVNDRVFNRLEIEAQINPQEALRILDGKARPVNLPENITTMAHSAAEASGVRPELVSAVIAAESAGNVNAVSSEGAHGLMQLMPQTQKELEKRYGIDGSTPEGNVKLGTAYLKELLQRYGGNERLALMAYNWGPGKVDAYIKSGGKGMVVPLETRQYVSKILGNNDQEIAKILTPQQLYKIGVTAELNYADSLSESFCEQISAGEISEAEALTRISKIENQKVRKAARLGLTERLQIVKAQEREDALNAGERAYDDMNRLANAQNKSNAAILSDMYKLRLKAQAKARTGTAADKAYFRSIDQIYSSSISSLGITNHSDPGVFIKAQNAIVYGQITNVRDLKAAYPTLDFHDMNRLESVLKSSQQVNLSEINRLFSLYAGVHQFKPTQEANALRMRCVQYVIDAARETNRGNDPAWVEEKVKQFTMNVEIDMGWHHPDAIAGEAMMKGVPVYPKIPDDERDRIEDEMDFEASYDPKSYLEFIKKHGGDKDLAYRARYWEEIQKKSGAREPERPDDVPDDAVWDKNVMGWKGVNPETGQSGHWYFDEGRV